MWVGISPTSRNGQFIMTQSCAINIMQLHNKVYYPLMMDKKAYLKYLIRTMVESMNRDFPDEAKEVLDEIEKDG